jgi:class 3 adenylate cyclase
LKKVELGIVTFTCIVTLSMIATQLAYIRSTSLFGLLLIDFSVFAGLVIACGFILVSNRVVFVLVTIVAALDIIAIACIPSDIPFLEKRFFIIELFILFALGVLVYYFSFLYTRLIKRATVEAERQKQANEELVRTNTIFGRFVPYQFMKLLNKENISDIRFGDQIQKNMTIMFADVRSFTKLSESMTPQETFDFLNSLLKFIGPTIRNYGGYIDKYIGDAVMSIFPDRPDDAIIASVEIQKLFDLYNEERAKQKLPPVYMGIGINTGDVIAGIIGEEERMQETVISDAVNLASRLEELTKDYGSSIIVSEESIQQLAIPDRFKYRFLDQIQVRGKILPLNIYEILDAEDELVQALKYEMREEYRHGWDLYVDGQIEGAIKTFYDITQKNTRDRAARFLLDKCREFLPDRMS